MIRVKFLSKDKENKLSHLGLTVVFMAQWDKTGFDLE